MGPTRTRLDFDNLCPDCGAPGLITESGNTVEGQDEPVGWATESQQPCSQHCEAQGGEA